MMTTSLWYVISSISIVLLGNKEVVFILHLVAYIDGSYWEGRKFLSPLVGANLVNSKRLNVGKISWHIWIVDKKLKYYRCHQKSRTYHVLDRCTCYKRCGIRVHIANSCFTTTEEARAVRVILHGEFNDFRST